MCRRSALCGQRRYRIPFSCDCRHAAPQVEKCLDLPNRNGIRVASIDSKSNVSLLMFSSCTRHAHDSCVSTEYWKRWRCGWVDVSVGGQRQQHGRWKINHMWSHAKEGHYKFLCDTFCTATNVNGKYCIWIRRNWINSSRLGGTRKKTVMSGTCCLRCCTWSYHIVQLAEGVCGKSSEASSEIQNHDKLALRQLANSK